MKATIVSEFSLSSKEDAPMTLAVSKVGLVMAGHLLKTEWDDSDGYQSNRRHGIGEESE